MWCFAFVVEGLSPQYEMGENAIEARNNLLARLLCGSDNFGSMSEGVKVA